jgi:hypothetical protein
MHSGRFIHVLGVGLLSLALAGCLSGSSDHPTSSGEVDHLAALDLNREALDARRGPNGEIDLQLALDMLASAFGVDMGVPTTTLPGEAHGNQVVAAIMTHWGALTSRQREVVNKALLSGEVMARWDPVTGQATDVAPLAAQMAGGGGKALAGTEGEATPIRTLDLPLCGSGAPGRCTFGASTMQFISSTISTIAARLGRPLTKPILFAYDPSLEHIGAAIVTPTNADGSHVTEPGGVMGACRMVFTNVARFGSTADAPTLRSTLAHELFHCFQNEQVLTNETPEWLDEGAAEWVAYTLQPDPRTRRMMRQWLTTPGRALFSRDYDALGYYQVMRQQGTDPWRVYDGMRLASRNGHDLDAYNLALPGDAGRRVAALIATTKVRRTSLGADWNMVDPELPEGRDVKEYNLADEATLTIEPAGIGTYASWAAEITTTGDVLTITGPVSIASVGFEGAPTRVFETAISGAWCLRPGGCACPAGTRAPGELLQGARGIVGLAIGALPGASVPGPIHMTSQRLGNWCTVLPVQPQPCSVVTAADRRAISGDPLSPGFVDIALPTSATRCEYVVRDTSTGEQGGGTTFSLYALAQPGGELPALPATARSAATTRTLGLRSRVVEWTPGATYPLLSVQVLMADGTTVIDFTATASSVATMAFVQDYLERLAALAVARLGA